ncbi:hypothetical protein A6R68_14693 [Neotoma lepida]|uniref:Uncharacterized protein n=1 Tax=Neotoma lepida TaxID=56216 RepID=A0A1A6HA50_NEOLE|nr:hypothetical protein A6R68_14693 [Neotoma lepida]
MAVFEEHPFRPGTIAKMKEILPIRVQHHPCFVMTGLLCDQSRPALGESDFTASPFIIRKKPDWSGGSSSGVDQLGRANVNLTLVPAQQKAFEPKWTHHKQAPVYWNGRTEVMHQFALEVFPDHHTSSTSPQHNHISSTGSPTGVVQLFGIGTDIVSAPVPKMLLLMPWTPELGT